MTALLRELRASVRGKRIDTTGVLSDDDTGFRAGKGHRPIREISVIRGCPRKALIHRVLWVRPGALVNNSG